MDGAPPKTVVIGAAGFLGRHFLASYRKTYPGCLGTARQPDGDLAQLDLQSPRVASFKLAQDGYRQALILAASTRLADCEQDPEGTRRTNVVGTLEVARQLSVEGIASIVASSDNVFDGDAREPYDEHSPLSPVTEYGRQKAELEGRIGQIAENHLVVRLGKVFSLERGDGTLLDEMAARLAHGETVRAAHDQVLCPVLVDDVVQAVVSLQRSGARGLYNVCAPEAITRFEIARRLARAMDVDLDRVIPIALRELGGGPRPRSGHMAVDKLLERVGGRFTPLDRCIRLTAENWAG